MSAAHPREVTSKFRFDIEHDKLERLNGAIEGIKHRLDFLTGIEITKSLFELVHKFAGLGEQIENGAIAAGLTTEEFQKLTMTAEAAGVSSQEMGHGLQILSRRLYEARMGGAEAIKVFRQAGISQDQVKGFRNSGEAMLALSNRFRDIKDPIQKAALAQELLGRGGGRMVAYLSRGAAAIKEQGDELKKLGLILSGPQVRALHEAEDSFRKLFAVIQAVGAIVAAQVAPVFKFFVDDFLKFFAANKGLIDLNISNWFETFAYWLGFVYGFIKGLTQDVLDLAKAFHFEGDIVKAVAAFGTLVTALWGASKAMKIINGALLIMDAELLPVVATVGTLVVALHDLYALTHGQETWTGRAFGGLMDKVNEKKAEYMMNKFPGAYGLLNGDPNAGAPAGSPLLDTLRPRIGGASGGGGSPSVSINAPVEIHNAPAGMDAKGMQHHIEKTVSSHVDKVHREATRSLKTPVQR